MRVQTQCRFSKVALKEMQSYSADIITNSLIAKFASECLKLLPVEKFDSVSEQEAIFAIDSIVLPISTYKKLIEVLMTSLPRSSYEEIRYILLNE